MPRRNSFAEQMRLWVAGELSTWGEDCTYVLSNADMTQEPRAQMAIICKNLPEKRRLSFVNWFCMVAT
jgi:hypothetical protein